MIKISKEEAPRKSHYSDKFGDNKYCNKSGLIFLIFNFIFVILIHITTCLNGYVTL